MTLCIWIDEDECFPDYGVTRVSLGDEWHKGCTTYDVPEATVERWERVIAEYEAVQGEIAATIGDTT